MRTLPNIAMSGGGDGVPARELSGEEDRLKQDGGEESGLEPPESDSAIMIAAREGAEVERRACAGPGKNASTPTITCYRTTVIVRELPSRVTWIGM